MVIEAENSKILYEGNIVIFLIESQHITKTLYLSISAQSENFQIEFLLYLLTKKRRLFESQ